MPSLLIVLSLAAALGARAPQRETGLIVFEDDNFAGRTVTLLSDTGDLRPSGMDKRISSVRVAPGETWELCTGRNFGGTCKTVTGNQSSLGRFSLNDKVESVRRVTSSRPSFGGGAPSSGLVLYGGPNFGGARKELSGAVADFSKDGNFNDKTMSLRVARGEEWDVCVGANYVDCRVVTGDVATLDSIGLVLNISSARPRGFSRGTPGGGGQTGARIVIYEQPNFGGRSATLTGTEFQLSVLNNRAGSVRVFGGGRWEMCDQPRFGGHCSTVTEDVRDLSTHGLKDRILSLRPR
jgi:hypothetical protein